jgi:hypothetical protein
MKRHRRTMGENPLDALIPRGAGSRERTPRPAAKTGTLRTLRTTGGKERLTVHLPLTLIDRVKNAVYWTPGLTLAGLADRALTGAVDDLERARRKPFPARKAELKGGRPLK